MPNRNSIILFAALFSFAVIVLPIVIFDLTSSSYNQYAGVLDYFRFDMGSEIPSNSWKNIEYNPLKGVRSLPIGEGSLNDMQEQAPDFEQINKDVDKKTSTNLFEFFKWIGRGSRRLLDLL
ncbi:MAG: hypothetical protein HYT37_02560 [Candidatus Sungbacteria bacterium]|nr:hypothetical protein [Candidatus Sungbacteria bacterium]